VTLFDPYFGAPCLQNLQSPMYRRANYHTPSLAPTSTSERETGIPLTNFDQLVLSSWLLLGVSIESGRDSTTWLAYRCAVPGVCDKVQLGLRESLVQLPSCDGWTDSIITALHDGSCTLVSKLLSRNEPEVSLGMWRILSMFSFFKSCPSSSQPPFVK
jgi:hypothetical protein